MCCVYYYSAAKCKLPILQPSNMAAKCGVRRSWTPKVKPNLGWRSNITIHTYFLHFSFCLILILPRLTEFRSFKYQGHIVSLWPWPLTCDLEFFYLSRSFFMHAYLWKTITIFAFVEEIFAFATCSRSQPLLNMNMEGNFQITMWRHRWYILGPNDVISDIMNTNLYKCSNNSVTHMYRKINDDIFVRFLVIMKMLLFHSSRKLEGRFGGYTVMSSMTSSPWKIFLLT